MCGLYVLLLLTELSTSSVFIYILIENIENKHVLFCQDNIWCTATVLVYLEKNFSTCHTEWEMIKNKAIKWMTLQDRDGKTVAEILQEVKESV